MAVSLDCSMVSRRGKGFKPVGGDLDWFRSFHFSLPDLRGLLSRQTAILVMMAVFLFQGVEIFYKVLTLQLIRMKPATAAEIRAPAAAAAVREPADAYRAIPERNLFGTTTKAVADKPSGVAQQDVGLLIDLKGTVAGETRYEYAILEEKGTRKQRLVKAGDVIAGAKVVRITRNTVGLLIEDRERTLKMAETKEAHIFPQAAGAAAPSVSPGSLVLDQSEIGAGLEDIGDMGSMLRQAQVRPYFNAGVSEGFMISNIKAGSLYQRMGIIDGDIIRGVNNRPIRTADDISEFFDAIKSGADMALSITRRGKPETLNYQFR
jgi:general secretion pathway protein C